MELTRSRVLYPSIMASVEVPYDMKEDRTMGISGWSPLKIFPITPFKY